MEAVLKRAGHEENAVLIASVHEKLKEAKIALVTEYRGLTVAQMTQLRKQLREASAEYKIIKNTLVKRALKNTAYESLNNLLEGPTGWIFGYDDPVVLSKTVTKFIDDNAKLTIKGGLLEGEFLDQAKVKDLSKMPGRNELLAKLLALMQAPATQLLRLIQEPGARTVRFIEALRRSKETNNS